MFESFGVLGYWGIGDGWYQISVLIVNMNCPGAGQFADINICLIE